MAWRKNDVEKHIIARCGLACEVCRFFNQECLGCENGNRFKSRCLIFNCTEGKNIRYCTQCQEYPCKFMAGLSKAYCPVFSEIKSRIKASSDVVNECPTG